MINCESCGTENAIGSNFCVSCGTPLPATCNKCGSPLLTNARFCSHCGAPILNEGRGQTRATSPPGIPVASPFQRIRARSLILWVILGIPILAALYVLAFASAGSFDEEIDPLFNALIFEGWLYGLLLGWGLWKTTRNGVNFGPLIGRIPVDYRWRSVFGVVSLLIVFSLSAFWLFSYWLAVNAPDIAEFLATGELFATGDFTQYPGLYNAQVFVVVVIVAPVVEEFIFRGLLLTRWSLKWGATPGILVSSLVFALLHGNPVGIFAFGVVMSLLYIRTRTLLVPIAAHSLNNLVALGLSAFALTAETDQSVSLIEDLESGLGLAVVGAIATVPVLLWYVVRNWPRGGQTAPYVSQAGIA